MKRTLLMLAFLMLPTSAWGQSAVVTGTATDSQTTPYISGTWTATLSSTSSAQPIWQGNPNFLQNYGGSLDTTGSLNATLPCNTGSGAITVGGLTTTQWKFTIAASDGGSAFAVTVTIACPGPQSISASLVNTGRITFVNGEANQPPCGSSQTIVSVGAKWGCGSGGVSSAQSLSSWQLSLSPCGSTTNCTQINGTGHYVVDTTSNSTVTVTCPNNDCNFTSNDAFGRPRMKVGQKIWATTQGTGFGSGYLIYTTYVCPVTTVASFTAQSVTLNLACTASGTGNVVLIWGDDDGSSLASLDGAVGCAVVHVPSNVFILDSQPFFVNSPAAGKCDGGVLLTSGLTASVGTPAPALIFDGGSAASQGVLIITPDFNWANCQPITGASKNVCIGGTLRTISNMQVWGTGLTSASNSTGCAGAANKILVSTSPVSSVTFGVDIGGVCPGASGMIGFEANSFEQRIIEGGVQSAGTIAANVHAPAQDVVLDEDDFRNDNVSGGIGLNVESGAQAIGLANFPIQAANIAGDYTGRGDHFVCGNGGSPAVTIQSTGTMTHIRDYIGVDSGFSACNGVETLVAGASSTIQNTKIGGSTTSIVSAGTVTSLGGNSMSKLPVTNSGGSWTPRTNDTLYGTCRGTATSSATLGLYGLGQNSTPNCTSTTVNIGAIVPQVPLSGSVFGLVVYAGTGCKSGNTCVFTVLKNGSATTITCSMVGPASFCADNTHFDVPVFGDTYSVQFTTGATETLANVAATLLAW